MIPTLAGVALAPLLLWQGRRVRRQALRLPEAAGAREGEVGSGALCLRLLIVGDSSAAGVGAASQDEALAGQLSRALAQRLGGQLRWQLLGCSGHTTAQALAQLRQAQGLQPADAMVTALGVNDVSAGLGPECWLQQLAQLHALAVERAGVRYTLHSAVPPMHDFPLLPQPLRWWMGDRAASLNQALAQQLQACGDRGMESFALPRQGGHALPDLMAADGFHPGPAGYALWAEALAERLAREWQAVGRHL
ncbi:MAG: SGNH/GDSL hydrolase family protein [Roseateles asaccharophilus]|uniref:SGNH/GDSL hydrolase family protein n=1 Tax=Roseateles asaccharophilus TaxID=582607 RepID=UPI00391D5443